MKKIKIDIPKGYKASFDEAKAEISFVEIPKNPREKFNVWGDILKHHNLTDDDFNKSCSTLRPHQIGQFEEELVVAAYNGRQIDDPLPIFGDGTGPKGYPIFKMPSPSGVGFAFDDDGRWHTRSDVGARLSSESRQACEHIAEIFDKDYKAMKIYKREVK